MRRLSILGFVVALTAAFVAPGAPAVAGPRCGRHSHFVRGHFVGFGHHRHYVPGHCT